MMRTPQAFLLLALLLGAFSAAHAEDLTVTGIAYDQTCYTVVTDQSGKIVSTIKMPKSITDVDLGTTVGIAATNNVGIPFTFSARTAGGTQCNRDPVSKNVVTKMVAVFDSDLSLHDTNGKPFNHGSATGVTIDLVPFTAAGTAPGLDLRKTAAADQYGNVNAVIVSNGTAFTARYYKTNTDPAGPGDVVVKLTVTNKYQ